MRSALAVGNHAIDDPARIVHSASGGRVHSTDMRRRYKAHRIALAVLARATTHLCATDIKLKAGHFKMTLISGTKSNLIW